VLPDLRTARLHLLPLTAGDADRVRALLIEPEVRRYLCDDRVLTQDEVAAILARCLADAGRGLGLWAAPGGAGRPSVMVGLHRVPDTIAAAAPDLAGEIEVTIALAPAEWGRGLASDAVGAVLRHGFGALGLAVIHGMYDAPNRRSRAMLRRLGFVETGRCPGPAYPLVITRLERGRFPAR
jgi:[ribosomal protein S5]-alanine N-acetyltransferase